MSETSPQYTLEEIKILFEKHKYDTTSLDLRKHFPLLARLESADIENIQSYEAKLMGKQMLSKMGFNSNSLYTNELYAILDSLYKNVGLAFGYTLETLTSCIITEILDYYNSRYDEGNLLSSYGIQSKDYLDLKIRLHDWCNKYYWKPKISI